MKRLFIPALSAIALGLAACSNDPTVTGVSANVNGGNVVFSQVDRIGKPGIKELFLAYGSHSGYNQNVPENDPSSYGSAVSTFVTGTGGRSAAIGSFVSTLLLPDALIADFNVSATRASYLGWETSGQLATDCTGLPGTLFGGRALDDDVVDTDLGLVFGNLATSTAIPAVPTNVSSSPAPTDDGAEKNGTNGTPNLTNENVACPNETLSGTTFPYLADPL